MKYLKLVLAVGSFLLLSSRAEATSNPASTGMTFDKAVYQVNETGILTINMGAIGGTAICAGDAIYTINIPNSMRLNQTNAQLQASLDLQTGGPVFSVGLNTVNGAGTTLIVLNLPNGLPGNTDWDLVFPVIGYMQAGTLNATLGIEPNATCAGGNLFTNDDNQISPVIVSGVLPLTLTSFTAKGVSCGIVDLNWTTVEETGVRQYGVEYSTDGRHFSTVKMLTAKNAKEGAQYTSRVNQKEETGYYRLKMIDLDQSSSYSSAVKVTQSCTMTPIKVYPNPSSDVVNISTLTGTETISIVSIDGRKLLEQAAVAGNNTVNISKLVSGNYSLVITNGEEVRTFKLSKN